MPRRPKMSDDELNIWFLNQKTQDENGCWNWTGVINSGYGQVNIKAKRFLVHRYSLQLHLGRPVPKNLEVRHMCHNTKCFNPLHLKEGTHSENMKDMVQAGRQAKGLFLSTMLTGIKRNSASGERNGKAKLNTNQVLEIKKLLNTNTIKEISKMFNVSKPTISNIRDAKTWKNLK
jgi:hypothetical protein